MKAQLNVDYQDKLGYTPNVYKINLPRACTFQTYEEQFSEEEELNSQLNMFAKNFATIYAGRNEIKTQTGFDSREGKKNATDCVSKNKNFKQYIIAALQLRRGCYQASCSLVQHNNEQCNFYLLLTIISKITNLIMMKAMKCNFAYGDSRIY